jgi:hypothetical protein
MRLTNALPMDDGPALRDVVDFDGEFAIDVDLFVVAEIKKKPTEITKSPLFGGAFLSSSSIFVSIFPFHEPQSLAA